ncbi:MAG: TolC family protein [Gemmatimonadetes bacterium]|nr:TolC family protein [Gemmatimonadota bacterium]
MLQCKYSLAITGFVSEPTKQHLIEAAARVYSDVGFRGATTRRIADEAGVNEVTLFRLFGSKAALIGEAVRTQSAAGPAASLPEVPRDPEAELTEWAAEDHTFMFECRGMIRATMAEMNERPECALEVADHSVESFRALCAYVERLAEHGFIPSARDAAPAAAMLKGSLFADAMGRDMMPDMFPPADQAPSTYVRLFLRALGATLACLFLLLPLSTSAQQPVTPTTPATPATRAAGTLSLAEALRIAEQKSEAVAIAQSGVRRAGGQQRQATSQLFPQLNGTVAYQRAIKSQFQEISERFAGPPDTTSSGGGGLEDSPLAQIFAAPTTAIFTLAFSQNLYTAGRIGAARSGADAARTAADIALVSARAQTALDAAQAYFDAVAADRRLAIADSSLALTERTLAATQLGREVGSLSEFDLLRARVTRDNQRPLVIQARGARTTAYLRLKQLLDLPLDAPLTLTTPIRDDSAVVAELGGPLTLADERTVTPDTSVSARATVRQGEAQVMAQQSALRAARLARLPSLQLTSTYQRFAYPAEGTFLPGALDLYFPNWTVALGVSVPLFTGGRLGGDRMVAEANLSQAMHQLQQTREQAELDAHLALTALEQSQAAYLASVGTDTQAEQAYRIAEVRFAEGISTQLELTEVRVQLEQARLQRVNAARDLELAKLRLALLKDLPLTQAGGR